MESWKEYIGHFKVFLEASKAAAAHDENLGAPCMACITSEKLIMLVEGAEVKRDKLFTVHCSLFTLFIVFTQGSNSDRPLEQAERYSKVQVYTEEARKQEILCRRVPICQGPGRQ